MIARRAEEIRPFIVMDVLERARALEHDGVDVIHLEVGEPDFDTPGCVKEAICRALDEGHTHYTHSLGALELREAIGEYYLKTYNVAVHPDLEGVSGQYFADCRESRSSAWGRDDNLAAALWKRSEELLGSYL